MFNRKTNNHGSRLSKQYKHLVWRLSPRRGLGMKINEQDRWLIENEGKSQCSDQITQTEMLTAKYTPLCGSGAFWAP